jgi:hypothetical protein
MYALLILLGWFSTMAEASTPIWKITVVLTIGLAAMMVCEGSRRYSKAHQHPWLDLNPLKVGKRWRHKWADGKTRGASNEFLVAFLGPDCPYCTRFVRLANAMTESPAMPPVVGVVATSPEKLHTFISEKGIRFPVAVIPQSLMNRLAQAVPTAVLVQNNRIVTVWVGDMPVEFVDRFVRAFFPTALATQP